MSKWLTRIGYILRPTERDAACSFCLKQKGPMVEGPGSADKSVYICLDCAKLCTSIIEQEAHRREALNAADHMPLEN